MSYIANILGSQMTGSSLSSNAGFWSFLSGKLSTAGSAASDYAKQSEGGTGSTVGGMAGSAIGSILGPAGTAVGGTIGSALGGFLEGGLLGGGDESADEKYKKELAQSEKETRRWEERNAVSTAGIGQYLARKFALQNYPILGLINDFDFMYNKVLPYVANMRRR